MSLLWKKAVSLGMAWMSPHGENHPVVHPVKKAGFAGYVGISKDLREAMGEDVDPPDHSKEFDYDAWDDTTPDPTTTEQRHADNDPYGELPDSHHERHEQAYMEHMKNKQKENDPDIEDDDLQDFTANHGQNNTLWQHKGKLHSVSLKQPIYATQSHVSQTHIDKYKQDPHAEPHRPGYDPTKYLGNETPMFVTHQGRVHVTEGHHRVAAAIQRGDRSIHAWHYDADKHGMPPGEDYL